MNFVRDYHHQNILFNILFNIQRNSQLNLQFNIPFIYGLLTTLNLEQAQDRAGGKLGNKGDEAAVTAVKMIHLKKSLGL